MFVVDQKGQIIAHKYPTFLGKKVDSTICSKIKSLKEGSFEYKQAGTSMYGVESSYDTSVWKIVAVVPKAELASTANSVGASIASISEANTAATEEVTATIQTQSESNNLMNSLAEGLNDKTNELIKLINKFRF
ncbi:hypothetical protein KPL45_02915 [Clostridium estertheticum]|nr:hypothetical protein [Clostridium estertheticum]